MNCPYNLNRLCGCGRIFRTETGAIGKTAHGCGRIFRTETVVIGNIARGCGKAARARRGGFSGKFYQPRRANPPPRLRRRTGHFPER